MTVLIAEDDESVARFLSQALREAGYAARVVGTGPDAPTATRDGVDLVVLDVMLPGLNGFSVCRQLRARGVGTPILIITARDLLLLNQLERGAASRTTEEVSGVQTVGECLRWLEGVITERGSHVSCRWEREIWVHSSSGHLAMLVRNLVENAARHAAPNGQIAISTRLDRDVPALVISNDYPARGPLNLVDLAEPFAREDASRASSTGGNGLGLAICQAIAAHHGWEVTWCREGDQIRVTVRSPFADCEAVVDLAEASRPEMKSRCPG